MTDFVHLHVHSDFSLQDAAVSVTSLCDRAEELGMKYLALTDHGNMFGAMEFLAACKENGKHEKRANPIKPIIGCEVYTAPGSRFEKKGSESDNKYYHLILLAENREGYFNLVKLCSSAYTEGFYYRPRVDDELLTQYHEGLIALSACVSGEIPKLIQGGDLAGAEAKALHYRDLFGEGNFYLEIQDHGIPRGVLRNADLSQKDINKAVVEISRKTGIPLVATNDVHYLDREDSVAHDVLLCVGTGKLRTEVKRKKYYGDQFYFKTGDEMAALFPEYPEAIANTVKIAGRCNPDVPKITQKELPKYLPDFEIPLGFADAGAYLRRLTMEGLPKRYHDMSEQVKKQAEYELDVIIKMNFAGYFLIVADFINWAKDRGISVGPGRGSGAGSIVAYALRITDIDPLKYGLLFERFLNPERISMPDFDVDFCNERREEVMQYVTKKYGKERVGQIITFGTLGAKQVIKDVARVLDITIGESESITKLIPKDPKITLARAFEDEPQLGELEQDPRYTELFSLARKLEGLHRHSSLHAAGVVIGKSELDNYVPLYRDSKTGGIATQYTMNYLENCGLVKMDFLGLKTLDLIKNTVDIIHGKGGQYANFDIDTVDEHDPATYAMLGEEQNEGIFQFERNWWKEILRKAKPASIDELTALTSLGRPGPMQFIPQFIESKWNPQVIRYPDPSLEDVLKETYGVIVYQEQVMQVARIIAGYSMGQADLLRRAMGKKKKEIIDAEKEPFLAGAEKQGYSREKAGEIYDILVPFAGYGFNKSHAAAYSVLSFRTAYLKANFPAEFMAANLSNEIGAADKEKLPEYIAVTRRLDIPLDPPDVNRSDRLFTVVEGRIVYGLKAIKGIGDSPAEEIIRGRKEGGPYRSFMDFLDRVNLKSTGKIEGDPDRRENAVGKKVVELLVKTGAFDKFGVDRAVLLGNLETAVDYAQSKKDDKKFGQVSLFENTGEQDYLEFEFKEFPVMDRMEKLNIEKELIGFYISGHPLDDYKAAWEKFVALNLSKAEEAPETVYMLIGILKSIKTHSDKTGKAMAFASLQDYNGEIDLVFFGKVWESCQNKIKEGDRIAVKGRLDLKRGRPTLQVSSALEQENLGVDEELNRFAASSHPLDQFKEAWKQFVTLDLANPKNSPEGSYTLIGILTRLSSHKDKNDNDMAFGSLQDYNGEIDLVFFAKAWKECQGLIFEEDKIAVKGRLDLKRDKPGFQVSSLLDIEQLRRRAVKAAANSASSGAATAAGGEPLPAREESGGRPAADAPLPPPAAAPAGALGPPDPVFPGAADGRESPAAAEFPAGPEIPARDEKAPSDREGHIRLRQEAAEREDALFMLRDYLLETPGPCMVFIHVPVGAREMVIRTDSQIRTAADSACLNALKNQGAVAAVWAA
ncbi:MAG: DNA polymerase III subunit alpha [Treponema sp.]|jgi:DNA polymerase-3 subunit alpha|nr:DNA polymerase III subunit alpha [Treponema sp.]